MRFAVVSDIHLGDPMCCLVKKRDDGDFEINVEMYDKFVKAIKVEGEGVNDYLILLGDILDFSISQYQDTFKAAKVFFTKIQESKLAEEMIFVPGNHDADLWHTVEYQVNIIKQIKDRKADPRPFRLSVPGIIDDRKGTTRNNSFTLAGVSPREDGDTKYADLFLDHITQPPTRFNFAYPNVYVVTDAGTVLLTHGQYFELYWAISGELAMELGREDLKVGWALSLKDMVGINFPLSQLACSGIGQAGPLTDVARSVQREVKDRKLDRLKKYFDRLEKKIDKMVGGSWFNPVEFISDKGIRKAKERILDSLGNLEGTRFSEEFMEKPEVMQRFLNFYSATIIEIDKLNNDDFKTKAIPWPRRVIFGHTHQPNPWSSMDVPTDYRKTPGLIPVYLHNTGGWLYRQKGDEKEFVGAEIFTYSTKKGFNSVSIR